MAKLSLLHPDYNARISQYIRKNPLLELRNALLLRIGISMPDAVLVLDHDKGGGTEKYMHESLLTHNRVVIRIIGTATKLLVKLYYKSVLITSCYLENIEQLIRCFLSNIKFSNIYINHLITFTDIDWCFHLIREHSHQTVYLWHDYYAICPSYKLIDYKGKYCGAETSFVKCTACIKRNKHSYTISGNLSISEWRYKFTQLFDLCDELVCFSESGADVVNKIFPLLRDKIIIKPHVLLHTPLLKRTHVDFMSIKVLTVAVLGAINYGKGLGVIEELAKKKLFLNGRFKLVIIGYTDKSKINNCKITGKYDIKELSNIVMENKIDFFVIPSIWPETYCYVADEIMAMGFPLVSFNIGAHAQRIEKYKHGYLVKEINAESLYQEIISVSKIYGAIL